MEKQDFCYHSDYTGGGAEVISYLCLLKYCYISEAKLMLQQNCVIVTSYS